MTRRLDERVRDLLYLVAYVSKHQGARLSDVARRLGVPREQVAAYVDELLTCGRPPFAPDDFIEISAEGDRLHVYLDQRLGRPLRLSTAEALALAIALRAVVAARGEPWAAAAASALGRVTAALGRDVAGLVAEMEGRIVVEGGERGAEERLDVISRGVRELREVEIAYWTASRDELTERRVRPYLLDHHRGSWYLVGHDGLRGEERIFKVERIKDACLLRTTFTVPRSFRPAHYRRQRLFVADAARTARVRFHPPLARVIAEDWDAAQLERESGGTIAGRMAFVATEGLAAWILGHGPAAEVLEPADLRAAVVERARAALAAYEEA